VIELNKQKAIESNRQQYQKVKFDSQRAKSCFRNTMENYFNTTSGLYQSRIESKHHQTENIEHENKRLEMMENQLLNKLQTTMMKER
jgi:hypothetical protein